ncbi:MAG: glycosyltransferase family A protein [Cyclobacteriaceae bacterium]
MEAPKFSIIIPAYNRENFILDTINSVLSQTYSSFELVIVDDGSTDQTSLVVSKIEDPRVRYFYIQNSERGAARNYGIAQSEGSHLLFLDSDDFLLPDCLYNYSIMIAQNTDFDCFAMNYYFLQSNGVKVESDVRKINKTSIDYIDFLNGNYLACNFCFERTSIKYLFQESRTLSAMEDWIFLIQNLRHQSMYLSKTPALFMNDHEGRSMRANHWNIVEKVSNFLAFFESQQSLSKKEYFKLTLTGNYLRSIHAYLCAERGLAIHYSLKGLMMSGQPRFLMMLVKALIGHSLVNKLFGK